MKKIIENIGWIFFDKLFRLAAGVLVGVWIARYLGPDDFGLLNYAILFPTIFTAVAGLGLNNVLMVEFTATSNDALKKHQMLSTSLILKVLTGCIVFILALIVNYFLNRENKLLFVLVNISSSALILQSIDVVDTYFQSQTKAKMSVIIKLITFFLAVVFRIYGLFAHCDIVFFAIVNVVELVITYGLMLIAYQRYSKLLIMSIVRNIDFRLVKNLILIGWPIMFTEFFVYVYMKIDQFMIESLSTNKELGLYGAALRLSETWYFIAIAICSSLYPKIAELWLSDRIKFYQRYQLMLNILTYISISLSIFISIFADQLIKFLYGIEFIGAGNVLRVHIWAGIFVFVGVGINNLMIIKNLQKFVLVKTITAAGLNIALNFWLIPKYGAVGASVATLISYSLSAYGMNLFYKPSQPIFLLQTKSFVSFFTFQNPIKGIVIRDLAR